MSGDRAALWLVFQTSEVLSLAQCGGESGQGCLGQDVLLANVLVSVEAHLWLAAATASVSGTTCCANRLSSWYKEHTADHTVDHTTASARALARRVHAWVL